MTSSSNMQQLQELSYLTNGAAYLEEIYEQYLKAPQEVDASWRQLFDNLPKIQANGAAEVGHTQIRDYFQKLAMQPRAAFAPQPAASGSIDATLYLLMNAYRSLGHLQADLDPLRLTPRPNIKALKPETYGFTVQDLSQQCNANLPGLQQASLQGVIDHLTNTYCATVGYEYMHITDDEKRLWLQQRIESGALQTSLPSDQKLTLLQRLIAADGLEKYLGARFVGQKRFSLEGGDSLIPLLDALISEKSTPETKEVVIGMAHRGRLNVLINVLGKAPEELFKEFEGKLADQSRSGDVKYHQGFSSDLKVNGHNMHVVLAFNPSHLEIISPVVEGSVRSRQERRSDEKRSQVLPISIHGDAAFAGQGVVMETFNMSRTHGYSTGGTVHIVVNNQVGFTTSDPLDARSTRYCTDIAKMIEAPVFHVNGDDVEKVFLVGQLAMAYRQKFNDDVIIDLVCYRRHGHNEADEPSATQPLMYSIIKARPTARQIYAEQLIKHNIVTQKQVDEWVENYRQQLDKGQPVVHNLNNGYRDSFTTDWTPYLNHEWDEPVNTAVAEKTLQELAVKLEKLPEGFVVQPQVLKLLQDRQKMTRGELAINWGYAETLAYASLLNEGYPIRLSGQDSGRGTFAHRHAVLHDQKTDQTYIPLTQLSAKQPQFLVIDSLLSEEAVMAFEYGYATTDPKTLVIWEAQFGDFANGAQVVIDQFISSGEQKWGRLCGLTLLLPHGFEGQGPEHSSARLERYLQLCAQHNMQVCVPSTPAQVFHMLRRQMIRLYRRPLVVMSPKSILRHKLAISNLSELANGNFKPVIHEIDKIDAKQVKTVVLCSGKVYYDLLEARRNQNRTGVALIRIEQLYPFPEKLLTASLTEYAAAKRIVWCQEEPQNQGAWYASRHHLEACLQKDQKLEYAGRIASASPAVGSPIVHAAEQQALIAQALG